MHLSDHDLRQMDEGWLEKLPEDKLRQVSARILQDLKEARDRLNQTPDNSSRPPSSRAPWEKGQAKEQEPVADKVEGEDETEMAGEDGPSAADYARLPPGTISRRSSGPHGLARRSPPCRWLQRLAT